jgi:DNA polymerase-1
MISSYKICLILEDIYELIGYIYQTGYACIDFETSSLEYYEESEYPTILGISFQPGSGWIIPLGHYESPWRDTYPEIIRLLKPVLEDPNIVKIAWNAKYEYKWLLRYGIEPMGRFFDAMLLKYLLKEDRPHDLKSMVDTYLPDFGGYALKGSNRGNFDWRKVPLKELSKYCALDTDNTLRLFLFLEPKVIDLGFYSLFRNLFSMLVRVLGKCEHFGMKVDKKYLSTLVAKYSNLIQDNELALRNSKKVKRYERKRLKSIKEKLIEELEEEIEELESRGASQLQISNRVSKITAIRSGGKTTKNIEKLLAPINFGSPKQMAEFLYESPYGLELPILDYTDSGAPSSAEETLLKLKEQDSSGFIDRLLKSRELEKLNSTYITGIWEKLSSSDRIHSSYKINGTVTGRLSSTSPNMQNVPRVTTNPDIKPMFTAPSGYALVELDYSQAELRIVAELAKEKQMIEWFQQGHNIHVAVAAKVAGVPYETAYPITKDENHPEHKEWTKRKKRAKTINFGILYEQGPSKLAVTLKCTKEEAAKFKQEWLETFPAISKWINRQHKLARKHGFVYNMWGFKRRLPEIYSSNKGKQMEAERQSVNAPIQGAASFFTLFSAIVIEEMRLTGQIPLDFPMVYTVHDSLGFYVRLDKIHEFAKIAVPVMANPQTQEFFGFQMKYVPMKASMELGLNWGSYHDYSPTEDYTKWALINT